MSGFAALKSSGCELKDLPIPTVSAFWRIGLEGYAGGWTVDGGEVRIRREEEFGWIALHCDDPRIVYRIPRRSAEVPQVCKVQIQAQLVADTSAGLQDICH